jgi:uncharacterized protein (TIRG00374 family)
MVPGLRDPESAAPSPAARPAGPRALDRRQLLVLIVATALAVVALYGLLPALAGLEETWERVRSGNAAWLTAALAFELLSYASYVVAVRAVIEPGLAGGIGWRDSARVTMAGVVASRLFAAAGVGGIAVTAWALHRLGMEGRELARRLSTLMVLLYGVYMAALALSGLGLWSGILAGPAPIGLTLVPALLALAVIAAALAFAEFGPRLDPVADRISDADGRRERLRGWLAAAPATVGSGVRTALEQIRTERLGLGGAAAWWAFDIAVLAACLAAFGDPPTLGVIVCAYFVGMSANAIPLPSGVGAVDGGMIAALIGFGVDADLAIVGVLSYRFFAFWLPIAPGAIAYAQLLRRDQPPA